MEECKVGEYVRTKKYGIKKIDHLAVNPNVTVNKYRYYLGLDEDGDRCYGILKTTDIVKHSENILDLIEVGDIVHTRDVLNEDYYWMFDEEMVQATKETILEGIELVDILTREQYQQNCFKVEE